MINGGALPNRGVTLGSEEAAHTARMFGWEVVVVPPPDSLSVEDAIGYLDQRGVTAIVGDLSGVAIQRSAESHGPIVFDIGQSFIGEARGCSDVRLRLLPVRDSTLRTKAGNGGHGIPPIAWHPSLERYGAGQLNERFRHRFGEDMDERAWAGWMATKILVDAVLKAGTTDSRKLEPRLIDKTGFDGHKGVPLYFDAETRELVQPLFYARGSGELEELSADSGALHSSNANVAIAATRCGAS